MHHIVAYQPSDPLLFFFWPASWRHQLQHDIRYISFMARSTSFRGIPSRNGCGVSGLHTPFFNDPNPGGRLGGQNSRNGWSTRNILNKSQTVVGPVPHSWNDHHIFVNCRLLNVAMAVQIPHDSVDYHLVMTYSLPWKDPPFSIGKPFINGPWQT